MSQTRAVGHRVALEVGLDGVRERELVDVVDVGPGHDAVAAELVQGQHLVGPPQPLHAVPLQRHPRQLLEAFRDVEIHQRRHLQHRKLYSKINKTNTKPPSHLVEAHVIPVRVSLSLRLVHLSLKCEVESVANQNLATGELETVTLLFHVSGFRNILVQDSETFIHSLPHLGYPRRVLLHLAHPAVHALEAPLVGDVVDEEDALGAARVAADDRAEPPLAARVPDLQLHALPVDQDRGGLVS